MEPYVGEIRVFAGTFAPVNWLLCQGQTVSINQYQMLYSLLGTLYGGDGRTTFGIPNLSARVPVGRSNSVPPGLTQTYVMGAAGGQVQVTLTQANLPSHTHTLYASTNPATTTVPNPTVGFATASTGFNYYSTDTSTTATPAKEMISTSGYPSPQAHMNVMPSMGLIYIIATNGIYPDFN
ncbi:phage tail protein [Nitrospirillum iridis]|uniref:Microcystin-dependent protein n=1 Tax=Nitrospirillum iridis TaxID=765888 RepID=A0A7X0B0U9_9PROT|nr:tail fiber protein [Nitrospirillum iridis]MBB6253714.1 microcystin-dependent protein [Nitrospirillum iridis]